MQENNTHITAFQGFLVREHKPTNNKFPVNLGVYVVPAPRLEKQTYQGDQAHRWNNTDFHKSPYALAERPATKAFKPRLLYITHPRRMSTSWGRALAVQGLTCQRQLARRGLAAARRPARGLVAPSLETLEATSFT